MARYDDRTSVERKNDGQIAAAARPSPPPPFSINLKIAYLPPDRLHPSANNARTHSKKQLKTIARSIERFGFVNPVLISDDGEIIAGHGRVEAAKMLGLRKVPTVRLSNLSPADRRAYIIADNRLAELADWDHALLASELRGLIEMQFDDVELTGFSLDAVDLILDQAAEQSARKLSVNDKIPTDLHGTVVSRAGDVWALGAHRLHCGDEPRDCDVIIKRWQQFTKKTARLAGTDLSFAEAAAARVAGEGADNRAPSRE